MSKVKRLSALIFDFFALLAVDPDFDGQVGLVFAAGFDVVGEGFDDEGRVAGAVPVGGVLAVVDEVLDEPRRDRAFAVRSAASSLR